MNGWSPLIAPCTLSHIFVVLVRSTSPTSSNLEHRGHSGHCQTMSGLTKRRVTVLQRVMMVMMMMRPSMLSLTLPVMLISTQVGHLQLVALPCQSSRRLESLLYQRRVFTCFIQTVENRLKQQDVLTCPGGRFDHDIGQQEIPRGGSHDFGHGRRGGGRCAAVGRL